MLENKFKQGLTKELKERFPGCVVVHLDPNEQSIKSWQTIQLTSTRSSKSRSRTILAMHKVLKAIGRGLKIDTPPLKSRWSLIFPRREN